MGKYRNKKIRRFWPIIASFALGLVLLGAVWGGLIDGSILQAGMRQASAYAQGWEAPEDQGHFTGRVRYIVDGDSLYLEGEKRQFRLFGVDAPERYEPGYAQATNSLKKIAEGKFLQCVQVDIDRYGRIVGRCFIGDVSGPEVNQLQICSGTATEYDYFSKGFYARKGCAIEG